MKRLAVFEISGAFLLGLLKMSEETEFESVSMVDREGVFCLKVSHPNFPEVVKGITVTPRDLTYCTETHDCGHQTVILDYPLELRLDGDGQHQEA